MIARAPPERDRTGEYQPPRRRLAKQRREYARQVEDGRQVGCDGGVPYVLEFLGGVVVDVDAGQMNDRIQPFHTMRDLSARFERGQV